MAASSSYPTRSNDRAKIAATQISTTLRTSPDVAREFFTRVVAQARSLQLLSDEHFSVDGTLVEAWASLKSFKRKDREPSQPPDDPGNPTVNFHGERRSNATHQSTTDPEAKLAKKGAGKEAKLCYSANALMENRNGLLIEFTVESADGYAERKSARAMLETELPGSRRITLGADKGYDTAAFVAACRALKVTPHIARNESRAGGSALDRRTARHAGYAVSQRVRKRVEEIFGWMKTVGGLRRTRYRGLDRTQLHAYLVAAAYNLLRIARLSPAPA
jgi:IS5 family transposase